MEEKVPNLKLRDARINHNWTQEQMAEFIKASVPSVGRWERGEAFPSAYWRQKLCELFGMTPEELGFTNNVHKPQSSSTPETEGRRGEVTGLQVDPQSSNGTGPGTREEASATHQPQPEDTATPAQENGKSSRPLMLAGIVLALIVVSAAITYVLYVAHPSSIRPGGGWISPDGKTIKSKVYFAAYAYPTHEGDPAIDHVNFTLYWQGADPRKWMIACVSRTPLKKDVFACFADLHALGVPTGELQISFDVYDRQGHHANAPNGLHTVIYSP